MDKSANVSGGRTDIVGADITNPARVAKTPEETDMTSITKTAGVALFAALGIKTATKWNPKRMAGKLGKIDEMVDADTKLEAAEDATLTLVLKAIENADPIEVLDDKAVAVAPTPTPEAVTPEAPAAPAAKALTPAQQKKADAKAKKEADKAAKDKAKADAKAAKDKAAAKVAADKAKAEAKAKKEAEAKAKKDAETPGVRTTVTRSFLAGQVIANNCHEAGVTDAMLAELDALYGKENPTESRFCLKAAWHAIRGYDNLRAKGAKPKAK